MKTAFAAAVVVALVAGCTVQPNPAPTVDAEFANRSGNRAAERASEPLTPKEKAERRGQNAGAL